MNQLIDDSKTVEELEDIAEYWGTTRQMVDQLLGGGSRYWTLGECLEELPLRLSRMGISVDEHIYLAEVRERVRVRAAEAIIAYKEATGSAV